MRTSKVDDCSQDPLSEFEALVESNGVQWKDVEEKITKLVPEAKKEIPDLPLDVNMQAVATRSTQEEETIPALRAAASLRSKFLQGDFISSQLAKFFTRW